MLTYVTFKTCWTSTVSTGQQAIASTALTWIGHAKVSSWALSLHCHCWNVLHPQIFLDSSCAVCLVSLITEAHIVVVEVVNETVAAAAARVEGADVRWKLAACTTKSRITETREAIGPVLAFRAVQAGI